jgi:hypothetical protein
MPYVGTNPAMVELLLSKEVQDDYDSLPLVNKKLLSIYGGGLYYSRMIYSESERGYSLEHYLTAGEWGSEVIMFSKKNDSIIDHGVLFSEIGDGGDFYILQSIKDNEGYLCRSKEGTRKFSEPIDTASVDLSLLYRLTIDHTGHFRIDTLSKTINTIELGEPGSLPWD